MDIQFVPDEAEIDLKLESIFWSILVLHIDS